MEAAMQTCPERLPAIPPALKITQRAPLRPPVLPFAVTWLDELPGGRRPAPLISLQGDIR
jgi:hypothetical protein